MMSQPRHSIGRCLCVFLSENTADLLPYRSVSSVCREGSTDIQSGTELHLQSCLNPELTSYLEYRPHGWSLLIWRLPWNSTTAVLHEGWGYSTGWVNILVDKPKGWSPHRQPRQPHPIALQVSVASPVTWSLQYTGMCFHPIVRPSPRQHQVSRGLPASAYSVIFNNSIALGRTMAVDKWGYWWQAWNFRDKQNTTADWVICPTAIRGVRKAYSRAVARA